MRSVHKYYIVGCLAATLVLMVLGSGNQAQAQDIIFDRFDTYVTMFGAPDQAKFETNWPIDGSCLGYVVSNDYSRQNSVPISMRQDMGGPGTLMVKDIKAGAGSSSPANIGSWTIVPPGLVAANTYQLVFAADDGVNGVELWRTSGFMYTDTTLLKDINLGPGSSSPANIIDRSDDRVTYGFYFTADDGMNGTELWVSDGTAAGTVMVKDINPSPSSSSPSDLTAVGDPAILYFTADDGTNGVELWKSDGTTAGTVMVKDINPSPSSSSPSNLTAVGDPAILYFAADDGVNGRELWKSNGVASGTVMVKDINVGAGGSSPSGLIAFGTTLYFAADDGSNGTELWTSDGTAAGTVLVKDINAGAGGSSPSNLADIESGLIFTADDGTNGVELWKSDGSGAGTVLLKDINPGGGSSSPANLALLGMGGTGRGSGSSDLRGRVLFSADDGISGNELWRSDGTTAGTVMVKDIVPGAAGSSPVNLYSARWGNIGNMVFFSADDGSNGRELWQSDGTETGIVGSSNKRDLVPLIQALDPTKSAVAGTDANPFTVYAGFDLPTFGGDGQLARLSTQILEVTDGVDRAPVGPISMVDCGGGISRPQIPLTDGTTHNVFAIGVLAQLDPNPCDTDPDAPEFPQVPVVAEVVVYDGYEWHICATGKFDLTEDALVGKRWNWCTMNIKTNAIVVNWRCTSCEGGPTYSFTIPRQYLGGFKAVHMGTEACVKSPFDTYFEDLRLSGGKLVSGTDPTHGACCFDHTTCTDNQTQADCELAGGEWQGSFTYCADLSCCGEPFADYDYDGDVDQVDFGVFQVCYTGSGGTIPDTPPECDCFDRRDDLGNPGQDGSIDIEDFAAFEACWSGPTVPANPACDD